MSHVIKALTKCHIFDIIIPQKINKYLLQFSDHILFQCLTNFNVYHMSKDYPEDMRKLRFLTIDCSKKNYDSNSFFIISNLPKFPLACNNMSQYDIM